ncbi:MAG: TatD family hydrolase [Planctomycetes bacterium]|nr:TatD family hydrolase [Planctomycetota bacterium]
MQFIDTHAHLDDEQLAPDLGAVITRAQEAGVVAIVAVGTTLETSRQAVQLAREHTLVRAAVGMHPNYLGQASPADWSAVAELAREPEVVAIGETGLGRFRTDSPFDLQVDYFERHLAVARERKLPIVIHCRDAEEDVLRCLTAAAGTGRVSGVMHSFSGQAATAARCVELGLCISFAGQLTFKNRKFDALREVAKLVPLDRLLVETDSPYLAPEPHRGERNEPAHVRFTAERLAELRVMDPAALATATTANARRLFGLPDF